MQRQRLLELDALRGFAAFAVLLFHYFFRYNEIYGHGPIEVNWAHWGGHGVNLFFIISGFVIFWTLQRIEKPMDFLVSRFSRLYPVYWAALVTTFCVVSYFGLQGREVSLSSAVKNLLMFHGYLGIPSVDGAYWTLKVELTFYFWIFAIYIINQLKNVELWLSLLILVFIAKNIGLFPVHYVINNIFIIDYISFFVAGICFYKIKNGVNTKTNQLILVLSLASRLVNCTNGSFVVYSICYILFYCAVSGHIKFLAYKPFVFLGTISYSLYLIHQNIGYVAINTAYKFNFPPLLGISIATIIAVLFAYVLTKYIERPLMVIIRNFYKNNAKIQIVARRLVFSK
jgi:peptidoglycan/LPS O-acetylase OafA/YrhL